MIALFALTIVVGIVWMFNAPAGRFLHGFAGLLEGPRIERGTFSLLSGRSYTIGGFEGREVAIRLQLKRGRYDHGYLVVAMRTDGLPPLDHAGIEKRTHDEAGRAALSAIVERDLKLIVEEGWLKAMWRPSGLFIFPGPFSAEKWRGLLGAMRTLAASLEASG